MTQDADSYFKAGFHQLRCSPRLIIPFLISNALIYASVWAIIFSFVVLSLPILGKVVPIIEKNQDLISQIITDKKVGNYTDPQMQQLEKEFSNLFPEMLSVLIMFLIILFLVIIIAFILYAWANAGTIGYTWKGITESLDFKNFRYYARQNIFRVAGLWILIIIFSIILFLIPFSAFVIFPSPASVVVFILLMLMFFILWAVAILLLFFSEECIVIENKGVIAAMEQSWKLVAGNIGSVLLFIFISICLFVIYGIVSFTFELIAGIFNSNLVTFFELFSMVLLGP